MNKYFDILFSNIMNHGRLCKMCALKMQKGFLYFPAFLVFKYNLDNSTIFQYKY